VWLLGGAVVLVCSLRRIWATLKRDISERFYWGFVATLLVAAMMFWKLPSLDYALNGEGTHQVTVGLRAWTQPDLGYTDCGHFCYPVRQYLLAALPTLLFGRHAASVRLGFLWVVLFGMLVFYSGLRERLRTAADGGYLAAMAMVSIVTFPALVAWLRFIEQPMNPPSVMLAAVGWFLLSLAEVGPLAALCLSWIGAMLATVYTPGLAGWALMITMLLLVAVGKVREGKGREAALLVLATVVIVSFGMCSFGTRGDVELKLYQNRRGSWPDLLTHIAEAYTNVFFLTGALDIHNQSFMSPLLLFPIGVYLVTSLFWKNGTAHFVNAVWIMGVVGASCYLAGYVTAPTGVELRKALVLIPPAIAGTVLVAGHLLERGRLPLRKSASALFLLLAVYAGLSLKRVHDQFAGRWDRRLMEAMEWSLALAKQQEVLDSPIDVYIVSARTNFGVRDYVEYFFPRMHNFVSDPTQCFGKFDPTRNALILYERDTCEAQLDELRRSHQGFHELPVKYGLKGASFIPRVGEPSRSPSLPSEAPG